LLGIVSLLAVLLVLGAAYQGIAQARDRRNHPPLGERIEVNGLQLHIYCKGKGTPAVVFESGFATDALLWEEVQDAVAQTTRACIYDRAGSGWSQPDDVPITGDRIARNLKALLEAAGIEGPYILVGHSAGGLYVREFATCMPRMSPGWFWLTLHTRISSTDCLQNSLN
jgi:alpha-beta hydrolase superfamily lysophospholipase